MAKNLVIVESPAKAKTIQKYLGDGFTVLPTIGHIRELPKKDAIDPNKIAPTTEANINNGIVIMEKSTDSKNTG